MRFLFVGLFLMFFSLDSFAGIWSFKNNNKDQVYYYKINNGNVKKIALPDDDVAQLNKIEPSLGNDLNVLPNVYTLDDDLTPIERVVSLTEVGSLLAEPKSEIKADLGRVVAFIDISKFDEQLASLANQLLLIDGLEVVFYAKDFSGGQMVADYAENGGSDVKASLIKDVNNNIAKFMRVKKYPSFVHLHDGIINKYSLTDSGLVVFKINLSDQKK